VYRRAVYRLTAHSFVNGVDGSLVISQTALSCLASPTPPSSASAEWLTAGTPVHYEQTVRRGAQRVPRYTMSKQSGVLHGGYSGTL